MPVCGSSVKDVNLTERWREVRARRLQRNCVFNEVWFDHVRVVMTPGAEDKHLRLKVGLN